ncbi:hypothetical protein C3B61_15615 [Cryobacterium zongtaii]|uniref:Uncharacterized protein n=1 Tax=Cryobacterium zongtaii TaxID=1259217 RepID=A0A2S3Z9Q2_9MICO|nr:hypothetical protein [Cryobacterium zongtaii]POH62308.1 hypothetical protein C3B61_15615 [Cryobacterium zongtaii]
MTQKLAHSIRTVLRPSDSYDLLCYLQAAQDALAQVFEQLAAWHVEAIDGTPYKGKDGTGAPGLHAVGPAGQVAGLLEMAAESTALVPRAQTANGVVRWFDGVKGAESALTIDKALAAVER